MDFTEKGNQAEIGSTKYFPTFISFTTYLRAETTKSQFQRRNKTLKGLREPYIPHLHKHYGDY